MHISGRIKLKPVKKCMWALYVS